MTDINEKLCIELENCKKYGLKVDYTNKRTYKFKTPIKELLEDYSQEELEHMDDKLAEDIDLLYIDGKKSNEEAKRTCPKGIPLYKWKALKHLEEIIKMFK